MSISIREYMREQGFNRNPFETTTAEQEKDFLPACFVRAPWFDDLVGNPQQPQSFLLFAPRGYGKTSHRIELKRILTQQSPPVLTLELTDTNIPQTSMTLDVYRDTICQMAIRQIQDSVRGSYDRQQWLQVSAIYPYFQGYQHRFAPMDVREAFDRFDDFKQQTRSWGLLQWLRQLNEIAQAVGFNGVYVLIDGIDESNHTVANPEAMWNQVAPLLNAPNILQESGVAFKFFLPRALGDYMRQWHKGRLDRLATRQLIWEPPQLIELLANRLSVLSRRNETDALGRINAFRDLCAVADDVDKRMAYIADGSPRELFRLGEKIIQHHCDHTDDPHSLISATSIAAVLDSRDGGIVVRQPVPAPVVPTPPLPTPPAPADTSERLFFDTTTGYVWIGTRQIELSGLLLTCMRHFWEHRGHLVETEALIPVLYTDEAQLRQADPKENTEKVVDRLRKAIGDVRQPTDDFRYIRTVRGHGFRLDNYREQMLPTQC